MNNNLSDSNISDNTAEGNAFYEQYLHDISSGNIDFQPFDEDKNDESLLKTSKTCANGKQSVAGKVKGAAISQSPIESTYIKDEDFNGDSVHKGSSKEGNEEDGPQITDKDINLDTSSIDPVEDLVREWEEVNNKKLPSTFRKIAIQAATVHFVHQRGITVSDLEDNGFGKIMLKSYFHKVLILVY